MKELLDRIFERNRLNRRLHWTTIASEKILLAIIGLLSVIASAQYIFGMFEAGQITLADLFLLFIYVEQLNGRVSRSRRFMLKSGAKGSHELRRSLKKS